MIEVEGPGGVVVEFPDGTPPATIKSAMARKFGAPKPRNPVMQALSDAAEGVQDHYREVTSRPNRPLPSLPQAAMGAVRDLTAAPRAVAGALNVATSPLQIPIQALAGAVSKLPLQAYDRPTPTAPGRALSQPETQRAVASDFNTALSAAAPARAGGMLRQGSALPQRVYDQPPPPTVPKPTVRVAEALERGLKADPGGPEAIIAAARQAPHRAAFEAGGPTTRGMAEVVAQSPGPGAQIVREAMGDRSVQAMRERVVMGLEDAVGVDPAAVSGDFAGLTANLRLQAAPKYEKAYARPGAPQSDLIDTLMKRPSTRAALNRAARIAEEEGRDPMAMGFDFDSTGQVVRVREPSMQTMDYVKRGLDDVIEARRDPITKRLNLDEEGRAIVATARQFRDELVRLNSDYGEALKAGGEPLRLEDAFRSAPKLMSNGVSERVFAQRWTAMSEAEQQAWRGGWLNDVYEQTQAGKLNLRAIQSPAYQAKLRTVFGDDAAQTITAQIAESLDMQGVGQKLMGGSPTYGRQAARVELEAQDADPLDMLAEAIDTGLSPTRLGGKALKAALETLPRKDRSIIGDPAMNEALARALSDPNEMTRLLNLLEIARAKRTSPSLQGARAALPPLLPAQAGLQSRESQ